MATAIGDLVARVGADTSHFDRGMARSRAQLTKFQSAAYAASASIGSQVGNATSGLMHLGVAARAIGGGMAFVLGGAAIASWAPDLTNPWLLCATEESTKKDIDDFVAIVAEILKS